GGTGLYFRALLEGLFEAPDADPALREALLERARRDGPAVLYTELEKRDPETAARIHPQDARRITRALEIIEQTGMPVSELRRRQVRKPWIRQTLFLGLQRDRRDLLHRIEKRSRWMYDNGLIEETRWLVDLGCGPQHTALQALGYKECREYVLGRKSRDEALEETIRETGRYARRQMNWFRNQFETRWIDVDSCNNLYETVNVSLQLWRKSGNNIASRS
ncbi:MAG TPA: tRNA (adenosine(37)-N6)-dimethylallyltransferase MiaA, partial [bacterium]|nr:tRNA (adenosine(37)-N6)-dimethylallyltransferase MiaA [bacterium]